MKQTSKFEIGLDFRMAAHTGIGTHLRGLVDGFARNKRSVLSQLTLYKPAGIDSGTGFSQMLFDAPIYSLREQLTYPQLLKTCRVWHAPHYNVPYAKGNTKLVTTIHDIIHWKYRHTLNFIQRSYAQIMISRAVRISDHIITVSEHTKKDLIKFFFADPKKITVIYNGVASDFFPVHGDELKKKALPLISKYQLPDSFFLYVGMLKPHKNVAHLIKSYLRLRAEKKINSGLVIIGQGKKNSEELRLLSSNDGLVYLPKISYGELPLFYNLARALVHPALYEGFGLTVVESMACGTPVITTRRASLPEVGGDAAYYIDAENDPELDSALIHFDRSVDIKSQMFDACIKQAGKFSWDKAAHQTAAVYEEVLRL